MRTDDANVRKAAADMAQRKAARKPEMGIEESGFVDAGARSVGDLREEMGSESGAEEYNGEEVRKSMEQWRVAEWIRTGATGVAFAMAVVGIWGDGNGLRQAVGRV